MIDLLVDQAVLADASGFDVVTVAEHHGGHVRRRAGARPGGLTAPRFERFVSRAGARGGR